MLVKLSFDFDEETVKTLEKLAKKMGISEEEVIKIAIELYKKKKKLKAYSIEILQIK